MRLTVISLTDEAIKKRDGSDTCVLEIDGEKVFQVSDGEPEDNNLSRNFNDVWQLQGILERVFKAGKEDEVLQIEREEVDEY